MLYSNSKLPSEPFRAGSENSSPIARGWIQCYRRRQLFSIGPTIAYVPMAVKPSYHKRLGPIMPKTGHACNRFRTFGAGAKSDSPNSHRLTRGNPINVYAKSKLLPKLLRYSFSASGHGRSRW